VTPSELTPEAFLRELGAGMSEGERLVLCAFSGDPGRVGLNAWRPRPWRPGADYPLAPAANAYTTIASFGRVEDGSFRRRKEAFAAGRAMMIDDVGTKVPRDLLASAPQPTARVETSPGNEQWWYFFAEPELDPERFDALIRAFIAQALAPVGPDPGMSGITRVGRLPGHTNGKPHVPRGWRTAALAWTPAARYTVDELCAGLGLRLMGRRNVGAGRRLPTEEALERNRAFEITFRWLRARRMLKRDGPDRSGWVEMTCPWLDEHTGRADTGSAVREPAAENDYFGAFRCHHGHCADRGWSELTEWIAERSAEELDDAASAAKGEL